MHVQDFLVLPSIDCTAHKTTCSSRSGSDLRRTSLFTILARRPFTVNERWAFRGRECIGMGQKWVIGFGGKLGRQSGYEPRHCRPRGPRESKMETREAEIHSIVADLHTIRIPRHNSNSEMRWRHRPQLGPSAPRYDEFPWR